MNRKSILNTILDKAGKGKKSYWVLLDPDDVQGFAGNILAVLTDRTRADALIQKGFRNAARFRWETTARETLNVYNALA